MSKRFYMADIIGDGTDEDQFRPAVDAHAVNWAGSFPVNLENGHPLKSWTLVTVEAINHSPLLVDVRLDPLPDFPLDGKVSSINIVARNAMLAAMVRRGVDTSFVSGTDGYREVIRAIGIAANATFDENSFDVI